MDPIIINNFDLGIGDSPHKGFGLMKRVKIDKYPGAISSIRQVTSLFPDAYTADFTATASSDSCVVLVAIPTDLDQAAVTVSSTGTLPSPLTANTTYFLIRSSSGVFKLATTIANARAGTAIDITDTGSGTHTVTSITPNDILHIVRDTGGVRYFQDLNNRVWYLPSAGASTVFLLNGNTTTNGAGNGLAILENSDASATYLFAFRNNAIDVVEVTGATERETPSWTNGWQTMNTGSNTTNRHYAITAQDGIIYFTDDRYVGSIRENAGQVFDPSTGATYTYNNQALDLPNGELAEHLEELGINLLIAGLNSNKIYPWDRVSDSFNLPLNVPERGVYRLKNIGEQVYILAGLTGNVYVTQGSYVRLFKKIPTTIINNDGSPVANPVSWGGIDVMDGSLIFGVGAQTTGNSGAYLLYGDGRLVIHQIPSTGSTNVLAIDTSSSNHFFGYADGADRESNSSLYSSLEGVAQSPLYQVATKTTKGTFSNLEVVTQGLSTGSGSVRVSYRVDMANSFTTLDTFTFNSSSDSVQKNDSIGLIDIEQIQIQVEIDGDVKVQEVRLIP